MIGHDALNYLPSTRIVEFPRRSVIYEPSRPASRLFLLLSGRVKILITSSSGVQMLLRVARAEEFVGECSLVPESGLRESAVVMETAQAMSWAPEEVDARIAEAPKLAIALCQYFGRNNSLVRDRITTISSCKTGPRVMTALVQLSRSIGTPTPQGALPITGLTHQAIAEYVGTSREIVTSEMNRLRRLGYVSYSRLHTDIYTTALAEWMRQQGMGSSGAGREDAAPANA
jgi:CRP-like cAMP-binding protein